MASFFRRSTEGNAPSQLRDFLIGYLPALLICLLALSLRLLFLYSQHIENPILDHLMMDERMHDLWARSLASGRGLGENPFFRAPGYYGFLSVLYRAFGESPLVGRLAGCLLGSMSVLLILKLGESLQDRRTGIIAAAIAAIYWPLIYFDIQLLSPSLEIFLNLLLLLLVIQARKKSSAPLFFAGGVALGLSAITRPTILTFAPLLALWALAAGPSGPRVGKRILQLLMLTTGTLVCILPTSWYNYSRGGDFVLIATNGGVNFYIGNNPESNGMTAVVPGTHKGWQSGYEDTHRLAETATGRRLSETGVSAYWYSRSLEWIREQPRDWRRLMLHKFRLYWSPHEIGNNQSVWEIAGTSALMRLLHPVGFLLLSILAAGGVALIDHNRRNWGLLLLFAASSMLTSIVFFCNARYRLPLIPVLMLAAAAGIIRALELYRQRKWRRLGVGTIFLCLMALFVAGNPPPASQFRRDSAANRKLQLAIYYAGITPASSADLERAENFFRETLRLWPGYPEASIGLAQLLIRQDHFNEAATELERILDHDPGNIDALRTLAMCSSRSGETTRALRILAQLLVLTPDDAVTLETLGCLQSAIGRDQEAEKNLTHALSLDPALRQARMCLQKLGRSRD